MTEMARTKLSFGLFKVLVVCLMAGFSFVGGILSATSESPPYTLFRDAITASVALEEVHRVRKDEAKASKNESAQYKDRVFVPTVRTHDESHGNELILISGGLHYLKTHHEAGCLAWLIDRRGDVKHTWKYDPDTWNELEIVSTVPLTSVMYPAGIHLYDDGGLLVNYQGSHCFPFAIGMARFDFDSNLLWRKELLSHHWFTVVEDGRIYVPALHIADTPYSIGNSAAHIATRSGKILGDVVLILDAHGNVLDEISMLAALSASGLDGLLQKTSLDRLNLHDPTHLNDVRVVSAAVAESVSWLNAGDLLVSFRHLNTVGIIDAKTRRFKWTTTGSTVRQHSPRFYDNGVLIVDNRGGAVELGGTQLLHVDFERGLPRTLFPLSVDVMPDRCFTKGSGHLDLHPDRKRVLMAVTGQGVVWEIDLQQGKVLWEYIYVHPHKKGERMQILTAKYVHETEFAFNVDDELN